MGNQAQIKMNQNLFPPLSSQSWGGSIQRARTEPNLIRQKIQAKIMELNEAQTNSQPDDLAGHQCVSNGYVQTGDILVVKTTRYKHWAGAMWIGAMLPLSDHDVYRKMPCPKAGDHDKVPSDKARTNDAGKPPLAYLPWGALREVARVQAFGHGKYGEFYNYKQGLEVGRNISCAMRHLADFMDGKDLDDESKVSHLAHAACRALFALENIIDQRAIDDRYKQKQP